MDGVSAASMNNDPTDENTIGRGTVDRPYGLPERLPEDERILWQGRPNSWALARESLFIDWIAGYTLVIALWRAGSLMDLMPVWAALGAAVPILLAGALAIAILWLIAYAQARSAVYTITNKRVVMQIGAALTLTLNLPFREIASAGLSLRRDGKGTIAFETSGSSRISYLVCWPHARPWRWNPTQPAFRCIKDAEAVAELLAGAVQTHSMPVRDAAAWPTGNPATASIAAE
ncbi:MAG: photosynthetic complex putative assembly protein PuhB [Pseudomonadota bacterium]